MSHFGGGLEAWTAVGLPLEVTEMNARSSSGKSRSAHGLLVFFDHLSIRQWLMLWAAIVTCSGFAYWLLSQLPGHGLRGSEAITPDGSGLMASLYFSVVTATSVGYGDLVPMGASRAVAVTEAALGMLVFGAVIAKLLSHRQEQLIDEMHQVTFQERLGRVQTSLHLLIADFHAIAAPCDQTASARHRNAVRVKSSGVLLERELRTVRDLLYETEQRTDESTLASLLATLDTTLGEFHEVLESSQVGRNELENLREISAVALEICSDCVPREYNVSLQRWMDRIHRLAVQIGTGD